MNIHYPVQNRINRSILWLLAAIMIVGSVLMVYRVTSRLLSVEFFHANNASVNLVVPQPMPVPEPSYEQLMVPPHMSAIPVPQGVQLHPSLQPIPAPPSNP